MSKKTLKMMVGVAFLACAFGGFATESAWATPPSGFTATNIVGPVTLDDQQPAVESQPSITVGHENLRSVRALDKPHLNRGFSSRQAFSPATNVLAGYT